MSLIVLVIFITVIMKGTSKDHIRSDLFKTVIKAYVIISLIAAFFSSGAFPVALIGLAIYLYVKKRQKEEQNDGQRQQNSFSGGARASASGSAGNSTARTARESASRVESALLARPISRRKKVINEFNEKYKLTLTDAEVQRIAEASYVSEGWKREVEAMTQKYDTIGQWFQGPTGWLRVYIYAFQLQNISSDFAMQEQICVDALDEVIGYGCAPAGMSVEERVSHINSRYFTCFDEMSFMIAWRFLQQKGREHKLTRPDLVRNVDNDLEELEKKYRTSAS